jgi:hypothetical protein
MGHPCKGRFRELFEFKPNAFRFYAYRVGDCYLILSGAPKEPTERRQDRHREFALTLLNGFLLR